MDKFLKRVNFGGSKKDDLIKKWLINHLSNSVREVQYAQVEENKSYSPVDGIEAVNQLSIIIEAIFLHGLKDSLTHRFRRAIADVDERPEPSFWAPLLVISHRLIIDQITGLKQITTEVGQCRAWIRLVLNDCLLSSYLMTIRQDPSALKSYYKTSAFVRDLELLDVAQKLIEGFETSKTETLPYNSSLLNTWPQPSLYLSGIWAPTLKSYPVAPGDDVAQSLDASTSRFNDSDTCSISSTMSISSLNSAAFKNVVNMEEDEVLKIILAKHLEESKREETFPNAKGIDIPTVSNVGNSLSRAAGWSFDETEELNKSLVVEEVKVEQPQQPEEDELKPMTKSIDDSFNKLLQSHNMLGGDYIKTPDLKEIWQKFEEKHMAEQKNLSRQVSQEKTTFVFTKREPRPFLSLVGTVSRENGLDSQNFKCYDCHKTLDISLKPNVCAFTGDYFCTDCMSVDPTPIPAYIIHNWDFKTYPVSKKSYKYILEIKNQSIIDFKTLNPYIYGAVHEMSELQVLRNQLNFLRAYLYTCKEPIITELQNMMSPREYMYEHIHQYSLSDMLEIPSGVLVETLKKVVVFGKEHVSSCWLCSQKGFVCEICDKNKPLFPFDVEHVHRCDKCFAVYHKECIDHKAPCPRCERRKKREDLPLLGATVL